MGFLKKYDKTRALNSPRFFISSMCSLLDATKAISMPEKKAENKRDKMIVKRLLSGSIKDLCFNYVILFQSKTISRLLFFV